MACSSARIEQQVPNLQASGSNPDMPVAVRSRVHSSMVEPSAHNRVVLGSSPSGPTRAKQVTAHQSNTTETDSHSRVRSACPVVRHSNGGRFICSVKCCHVCPTLSEGGVKSLMRPRGVTVSFLPWVQATQVQLLARPLRLGRIAQFGQSVRLLMGA